MSNTQAQFGFKHVGYQPGFAPDMAPSRRMIQSSYATAIFFGDPVAKSGGSIYIQVAPGQGTSAVTTIAGVFAGCYYIPSGGGAVSFSPWFPGSVNADATALIIDSPGAKFLAAAFNTAVPATAIGQNIGWTTGSTASKSGGGFSTFCVDFATLTTGAVGAFTVVDMWSNTIGSTGNGVDNANPFNWVVVGFNSQWLRAGQTGMS